MLTGKLGCLALAQFRLLPRFGRLAIAIALAISSWVGQSGGRRLPRLVLTDEIM